MIEAGSQLANYRIVRLLGRGGMAEVYEAQDASLGRKVALKVLPVASIDDPEMLARFEREARAVAMLNHRGIVTVFDVGHTDAYHYFSMRLLSGGDLRRRIRKGLEPGEALTLLREMAASFAHAHQRGFVHRDVKPENIIFDDEGFPVLTDFGIAKALDSGTQLTKTGMIVGTPRYISPEQAAGRTLDARSDLYSLGVILFEMLTGKPPYDGPDAMVIMQKHLTAPIPKLPKALAHLQPLVEQLLAKDPNRRCASADDLIVQIDSVNVKQAPEAAKPVDLADTPTKVVELKDRADARAAVAERTAAQLKLDPENEGLRFQLLKLYYELERTEDFLREARVLRYASSGLNPMHWEVIEQMGRKLAPLSPLFQDGAKTLNIDIVQFDAPLDARGKPLKGQKYERIGENPPKAQQLFRLLAAQYEQVRQAPRFFTGLELDLVRTGVRSTPLVPAVQLQKRLGGARILLKREDLGDGGHAMLAAVGQVHIARALRKKRVAAGVRDVRLGIMLASAAARHGLQADIWVDRDEYDRQSSAIFQLRRLGAKLHPVQITNYRNNDIREAAIEEWLKHPLDVFWFFGLDAGPEPLGAIARDLVAVVGRETRRQVLAQIEKLPDVVVARGGDSADALGLFPAFLEDRAVACVCVEPEDAGASRKSRVAGSDEYDPFARPLDDRQMSRARAILGGMEYVSVKRELAWLESTGRIQRRFSTVESALRAHEDTASLEGLLLGLQTAHAMAWACNKARAMTPDEAVVVLVAESGDRDLWEIERLDRELRPQATVAEGARDEMRVHN